MCLTFLIFVEWVEELIGNILCLCYWAPSLSLRSFLFTGSDAINMQGCLLSGNFFFLSSKSSGEIGRQWPLDGRPQSPYTQNTGGRHTLGTLPTKASAAVGRS